MPAGHAALRPFMMRAASAAEWHDGSGERLIVRDPTVNVVAVIEVKIRQHEGVHVEPMQLAALLLEKFV